jgi:predicted aspartyl protease
MKGNGNKMGRFSVDVEIANNEDVVAAHLGVLDPSKVRRRIIRGIVDSGAAYLVLPGGVAKDLGLPIKDKRINVKYADGRRAKRSEADQIQLSLLGRDGLFNAIVEPKRETALIGAIVLEQLDLLVDCTHARLVPRDPEQKMSEIE